MRCPRCGSEEIVYSCEPKCCYNHVCAECTASFHPATRRLEGEMPGVLPPKPLPDCTEPAVACARCESPAVYAMPEGGLVCTECGALLALEYTQVSA